MKSQKRLVTTYSKSFFQNIKAINEVEELTNINNITSIELNSQKINLEFIGEELILVRSVILSSKLIQEFFKNPTYSEEQKLNILLTIFPGLTNSTKSFLNLLTERRHLYLLPDIVEEYNQLLLTFQNSLTVKLLIATALKEEYGLLLLNSLKKLTNTKQILLKVIYNSKLLGGLIIEYNSISIDATILKEFSLFVNEI